MAVEITCSGSGGLILVVVLLMGALRVGKDWFLCMYAIYEVRLVRLCQCCEQRLNYIFAIIHIIWEQSPLFLVEYIAWLRINTVFSCVNQQVIISVN